MTPTHNLFRQMYGIAKTIGDTYDYLPNAQAKYPFIYIGEQSNTDNSHSDLIGNINQTIHIYGLRTESKLIMELETKLHDALIKMREAYGYHVSMTAYSTQLLNDNTDVQPLLHVVMDVNFMYTRKGQ